MQKKDTPFGVSLEILLVQLEWRKDNYLFWLPFIVAVFVAASHVMSVTPRAVARSLIGRNVLPSLICTVADAGIVLPLTVKPSGLQP